MTEHRDLEAAVAVVLEQVTGERLLAAARGMVDIASPTGGDVPSPTWIAGRSSPRRRRRGRPAVDAQPGQRRGDDTGWRRPVADALRTRSTRSRPGTRALDVPGASTTVAGRPRARAVVDGDVVEGLGAGNPKGHAAVVMAVLQAFHASGVAPPGDVVGGFGAGGMPSFAVPGVGDPERVNTGHGVGAALLLERGFTTDYAVIAKPGWHVLHEEVGLVWIDVTRAAACTPTPAAATACPTATPSRRPAASRSRWRSWLERLRRASRARDDAARRASCPRCTEASTGSRASTPAEVQAAARPAPHDAADAPRGASARCATSCGGCPRSWASSCGAPGRGGPADAHAAGARRSSGPPSTAFETGRRGARTRSRCRQQRRHRRQHPAHARGAHRPGRACPRSAACPTAARSTSPGA